MRAPTRVIAQDAGLEPARSGVDAWSRGADRWTTNAPERLVPSPLASVAAAAAAAAAGGLPIAVGLELWSPRRRASAGRPAGIRAGEELSRPS